MFRASSFHTIDPKGRIIVPARFRDDIRAGGADGVMVSILDKALYAYTFNEWQAIEKKILSAKSEPMRRFKRFFLGNACECLCDKQGRILIPPSIRAYAGLEKEIVLVGMLDHFEIWSREQWDRENNLMEEELEKKEVREAIASLGL
ncbi:MraZ [Desulforapulum autotrophicum HRM2]|uniref:Transcriptional regulator MraZ n=1 Tax=Desulforapulum autotrophicum (strain ATCC 43914 / DSM 3382 / VKM B-1955 / HRM2) TaxID=177437 RepID=MRAZ_DESAH|nr:division/cell wall cluster transcriptional repressor MraZ [Desulforapulum autotrophicum]C0Q8N4.1 RecName: Full=Transcriptional regulator MraZ [Desulforapulum autotrophicum HRM2]ACN14374.1 MraZ [Desulforapulum autotrophicum HRM2]